MPTPTRDAIAAVYRTQGRRVLATLVRLLGSFDLAEEALHEAFGAALQHWPQDGLPDNPRAWLVATGQRKAIDQLRRQARFAPLDQHAEQVAALAAAPTPEPDELPDDPLRLIFTCCHPALALQAQVALTLREVCGLPTEAIAQAFLLPAPTLAQRIVRAKAKIRDARIPYQVPALPELPERLAAVLKVIYLVFNESHRADGAAGAALADETLRLARLLLQWLAASPLPPGGDAEARGLLALMLLHESRRAARSDAQGELVLLDEQDRRLWDRERIAEGCALLPQALASPSRGPYAVQAAIAALHAEAPGPQATDWPQITALYHVLWALEPTPVVALNRAVAQALRDGPGAGYAQGLASVDALLADGELQHYHLAHATRADLLRRLGRNAEAHAAYAQALALATQPQEQRFLRRRMQEMGAG